MSKYTPISFQRPSILTILLFTPAIRPYHFFYGPFLWYRVPPADAGAPAARSAVPDYRIIRNEDNLPQAEPHIESPDPEKRLQPDDAHSPPSIHPRDSILSTQLEPTKDLHPIEGAWAEPKNLWIILRYKAVPAIGRVLTYGTSVDVHALQAGKDSGDSAEAKRIAEIHARAKQCVCYYLYVLSGTIWQLMRRFVVGVDTLMIQNTFILLCKL